MSKGLIALSPLPVFIAVYLITSVSAGDFYAMPITVAFMLSSIYAVIVSGGIPLRRRIDIFSRGAGRDNMMLMLWIFVLAGAFANSAKTIGSIDATVNLTLTLLPGNMLLAGLFLAACFISLSIGTSVGTIVALTPIAAGIAHTTDAALPLLTAVVVGGSFFGDNLSFISDTTIVSTSTQGCKLSDKFRVNAYLAFPAAAAILILYLIIGHDISSPRDIPDVDYIKVVPYIVVLAIAILGMNVMAVLTIGIILCGMIGMICGSFNIYGWFNAMGEGIAGMGELIIITMMAGGMLELIKANGGIDYIIDKLTSHINSKRGAELSIAALVSITDICTANNTIAIITVGNLAADISRRFGLEPRRVASLLDTFSCVVQGILPYGAQLLMAGSLAMLSPLAIIGHLYYPMALLVCALASIALMRK